jgi:hypothetical protein
MRRGLVFLYAISVFTVIAAIGITIIESGDSFVDLAKSDIHAVAAQQAALSGMAYGEALIWRMLMIRDTSRFNDPRHNVNFDGSPGHPGFPPQGYVPMASWLGADPVPATGGNNIYVPLQGAAHATLTPNVLATTYTYVHEAPPGADPRLLGRFRIELRDCSLETPPASDPTCINDLFDQNMIRNGIFFQAGTSRYKPKELQSGSIPVADSAILYTMRVEGESLLITEPGQPPTRMAHVVMKQSFSFLAGNNPQYEFISQAFWYHTLQRGF